MHWRKGSASECYLDIKRGHIPTDCGSSFLTSLASPGRRSSKVVHARRCTQARSPARNRHQVRIVCYSPRFPHRETACSYCACSFQEGVPCFASHADLVYLYRVCGDPVILTRRRFIDKGRVCFGTPQLSLTLCRSIVFRKARSVRVEVITKERGNLAEVSML